MVQVKDGGRHGEKHSYSPSILKTEPTGFPDEFNVDYSERGGFSVAQLVKNLPAMQETLVQSPVREDPLFSCLENLHGQRSLVGYSPWGHKESEMIEHLQKEKSQGASEGFKPKQLEGWRCH